MAVPFGFGANAIARHSRLIVDDRDAASDDAIEQRGFADVRPSHYGDNSWHRRNMVQNSVLRKEK